MGCDVGRWRRHPFAKSNVKIAGDARPKQFCSITGGESLLAQTRARISGPEQVTKDATVAELGADGTITVLVKGTNEWVCKPGNENKIGAPPMCMNPMRMQWMIDAMQGKPKPTNAAPGMIYMLCGATQTSNTNPGDKTSPAIPMGPHWMITWPFNAATNGKFATKALG